VALGFHLHRIRFRLLWGYLQDHAHLVQAAPGVHLFRDYRNVGIPAFPPFPINEEKSLDVCFLPTHLSRFYKFPDAAESRHL
jgi:hypothetical protein